MSTSVKRVYQARSRSDGTRILVDRLWPRGLTKAAAAVDEWPRDLAPSHELRKRYHSGLDSWASFRKQYMAELAGQEASDALRKLHQLAGRGKITLLFASKDDKYNHAILLKELLDGARKPPTGTGPAAAGGMRMRKAARGPRR